MLSGKRAEEWTLNLTTESLPWDSIIIMGNRGRLHSRNEVRSLSPFAARAVGCDVTQSGWLALRMMYRYTFVKRIY